MATRPGWAAAAAHGQAYTVRSGDTLSGIAAVHGRNWHDVYKANRRTVGADPDLIFPGERLQL